MQFLCQFRADLWKWAKDCVFRMLVRPDSGPYFDRRLFRVGPACKYFGGQSTASGTIMVISNLLLIFIAYHFELGMVVAILDCSIRRITQARPSGDWPA